MLKQLIKKIILPMLCIFLASFVCVAVFLAFAIAQFSDDISQISARSVSRGIRVYVEEFERRAQIIARHLSADPQFIQILRDGGGHAELLEYLSNAKEIHEVDFFVVQDHEARVLIRTHDLSRYGDIAATEAWQASRDGNPPSNYHSSPTTPMAYVTRASVYYEGEFIGVIMANLHISTPRFIDRTRDAFGAEFTFYFGSRAVVSTLLDLTGDEHIYADSEIVETVLRNQEGFAAQVQSYDAKFSAYYIPITNSDGSVAGMISAAFSVECADELTNSLILAMLLIALITAVAATAILLPVITSIAKSIVAASEAKSKFLSNMSHEIRTPITAIIGMTDIAKKFGEERKDDCIDKIGKASEHLLGIINQILDISKIEAERFELDFHVFSFCKMLDEVTSVLGVSIEEKQLDFEINLGKTIPQHIVSDEIRLAQVITNLLNNAVKFTPKGGKISLSVNLLSGIRNTLRVEVSDTGIGISKEHQANIFDAFAQVMSSANRQFSGTGLGLAISKKIIEMMNGKIWVSSELGEGSRFTFEIPVKTAEGADACAALDAADSHEIAPGAYKGFTILVAEDVEINYEIISALLETSGLSIEHAIDGEQAVEMFRKAPEKYSLIFMDIQMPKIDGITATRLIRELGTERAKSIPIIAMTANVFQEDIDKHLKAGMNGHLGKPLDFVKIAETLKTYLT